MKNIIDDVDNAFNYLKEFANELGYEKICGFSESDMQEYERLLKKVRETNSMKNISTKEKGDALENIASFLVEKTKIFEVINNVRTNTNELDQLIIPNMLGKMLIKAGIINEKTEKIIGECKNYKVRVNVTNVGKFCSLLQTNNIRIGILFSYYGVSGKKWSNASGLIRKFYMSKEKLNERICVIDFNINDFEKISEGETILGILDAKMEALQYDTEYIKFLKPHKAEKCIVVANE